MTTTRASALPGSVAGRAVGGLLLAALISGLYWLPLRALSESGVADLWACALVALGVVPFFLPALRQAARLDATSQRDLAFIGLVIGGAFTCYSASLLLTDVVRALLLFYIAPVWSTLLELLVMKRRLTWRRLGALLLGAGGLWTILGAGWSFPLPQNGGDWLALASGLLWSVGALLSYRRPDIGTGLQTAGLAMGALISALLLALVGVGAGAPQGAMILEALPWLVPIALALTLPMWFLTLWGIRHLEPARATLIFMLEVCIGVLSAALLTEEPFGWRELAGMLLVLAAAAVELMPPPAPPSPRAAR